MNHVYDGKLSTFLKNGRDKLNVCWEETVLLEGTS